MKPKDVDEYIKTSPEAVQPLLQSLRQAIKQTAPAAAEKISYGMPYYGLNGRLLYFCAFKNHIGFYPMKSAIREFKEELKGYESSAGTIRFPLDKPLPLDLITKIVEFRAQENLAKKNKPV